MERRISVTDGFVCSSFMKRRGSVAGGAQVEGRAAGEGDDHAVRDAAIELPSDDPSATVDDVAAAAGLTRSTVYRRFRRRTRSSPRSGTVSSRRPAASSCDAVAREPDFARCMYAMIREAVRNVVRAATCVAAPDGARLDPARGGVSAARTPSLRGSRRGSATGTCAPTSPSGGSPSSGCSSSALGWPRAPAEGIDVEESGRLAAEAAALRARAGRVAVAPAALSRPGRAATAGASPGWGRAR